VSRTDLALKRCTSHDDDHTSTTYQSTLSATPLCADDEMDRCAHWPLRCRRVTAVGCGLRHTVVAIEHHVTSWFTSWPPPLGLCTLAKDSNVAM
jgi:hypothetical protein